MNEEPSETTSSSSCDYGLPPPLSPPLDYKVASWNFVGLSLFDMFFVVTSLSILLGALVTCVKQGRRRLRASSGSHKFKPLNEDAIGRPAVIIARHWLQAARSARAEQGRAQDETVSLGSYSAGGTTPVAGDTSSAVQECPTDLTVSESDSLCGALPSVVKDRFEVPLERQDQESWGIVWNTGAQARRKFIVATVAQGSPADRWNARQRELGLRELKRGDKLLGANDAIGRNSIEHVLVTADSVRLLFLNLEVSTPLESVASEFDSPAPSSELPVLLRDATSSPREMFGCRIKNSFIDFEDLEHIKDDRHTQSDPAPSRTFAGCKNFMRPTLMSQTESDENDLLDNEARTPVKVAGLVSAPLLDGAATPSAPVLSTPRLPTVSNEAAMLPLPPTPSMCVPFTPDATLRFADQPWYLSATVESGGSMQVCVGAPINKDDSPLTTCLQNDNVQRAVPPNALGSSSLCTPTAPSYACPSEPSFDIHSGSALGAVPFAQASLPACGNNLVGETASIVGLKNSPEFNGKGCSIEAFDAETQRYLVQVSTEEVDQAPVKAKVRWDNLVLTPPMLATTMGNGVGLPCLNYGTAGCPREPVFSDLPSMLQPPNVEPRYFQPNPAMSLAPALDWPTQHSAEIAPANALGWSFAAGITPCWHRTDIGLDVHHFSTPICQFSGSVTHPAGDLGVAAPADNTCLNERIIDYVAEGAAWQDSVLPAWDDAQSSINNFDKVPCGSASMFDEFAFSHVAASAASMNEPTTTRKRRERRTRGRRGRVVEEAEVEGELPEGQSPQAVLLNAAGQKEREDPEVEGGCGADAARVGGDTVGSVASDVFWRPSLRQRRDEPSEITMETDGHDDATQAGERAGLTSRRGEQSGSTMEANSLDDACRAVDESRPCAESGVKESFAPVSLEESCEYDDCGRHVPSKVVTPSQTAPKQLGSLWRPSLRLA